MRIALAGNPNSGKTTMYNALTGQSEKVGNWAGVTVEKKEHPIKRRFSGGKTVTVVDLPGAYSLSPFTSEEGVTRDYIKTERPDVIINIVDATNLSRSLFFTTQLLELGIPVVVALNKTDINEKKETKIDRIALSKRLGCPVLETVSTSSKGLAELTSAALSVAGKEQKAPYRTEETALFSHEAASAADRARYAFVDGIVSTVERRHTFTRDRGFSDKIDAVLTNRWVGLPIFALVMFLVFGISQAWLGAWIAEGFTTAGGKVVPGLVTLIGMFGEWVAELMANAHPLITSVIVDGIIGGVGAVVGFLPLVMVMYFLIALLEDCGYMARATVVLDPLFKKVGLSGKSVIPFVVGTGCAVPGVMACRTIRNERERRATAMLAPFMPCGAKLPVISLFAGAFFGESPWVGTLMYFMGIAVILLCALLVNRITGVRHKKSYFIMELPEYKGPSIKKAAVSMCQRGWSYIVKAGTVILLCNFVVHLMQTFDWRLSPVEDASHSILATVATPFAFFLAPIVGVVAWQLASATIAGFVAKENVVGTIAVCYGISHLISEEGVASAGTAEAIGITSAAALAFLMLNLFSPPCFAAIGAMSAELKSKKWLWAGIGLQLGVGYSVGFLAFFFGTLLSKGSLGPVWMPVLGWGVVVAFAAILVGLVLARDKRDKQDEKSHVTVKRKEISRV